MKVKLLIHIFLIKSIILLPCVEAVLVDPYSEIILPVCPPSLDYICKDIKDIRINTPGPTSTQQTAPKEDSSQVLTDKQRNEIATWFQNFNLSDKELSEAIDLTEKIINNCKQLFLGEIPIPLGFEKASEAVKPFIQSFSDSQKLMRTLKDMAQMSNPFYSISYLNFARKNMQEEDFNAILNFAHELSEKFNNPDVGYFIYVLDFAAVPNVISAVKEKGATEIADLIKEVDEKLNGTQMGKQPFNKGWLFLVYCLPSLFANGKTTCEDVEPYLKVFNEKIIPYLEDEFIPYVQNRIEQELGKIPEKDRKDEINLALRTFYTGFLSPLLAGGISPQELEKIINSPQIMKDVRDLSLIYRHGSSKIQFGSIKLLLALKEKGFNIEDALQEYNKLREKVLNAPNVGKREKGEWYKKLLAQFVSNYADFIARELEAGKGLPEIYTEINTLFDFGTLWPTRFSWKLWKEVIIPNWKKWQNLGRNESGFIQEYPSQPVAFFLYSGYDTNHAFIVGGEDEDTIWKFHDQGIFVVYPPEILTFFNLLDFLSGSIDPEKGLYPHYIVFGGHGLPDRIIGHMESPGTPLFSGSNGEIVSDTSKGYISTNLVSSLKNYFNRLVAKGGYVVFNACSVGDDSGDSPSLATVFAKAFGDGVTIFAPVGPFTSFEVDLGSGGEINGVRYYNGDKIVPTRIISLN